MRFCKSIDDRGTSAQESGADHSIRTSSTAAELVGASVQVHGRQGHLRKLRVADRDAFRSPGVSCVQSDSFAGPATVDQKRDSAPVKLGGDGEHIRPRAPDWCNAIAVALQHIEGDDGCFGRGGDQANGGGDHEPKQQANVEQAERSSVDASIRAAEMHSQP